MQFTTFLAGAIATLSIASPALAQVPVTVRLCPGNGLTGTCAEVTKTFNNGFFDRNGLIVGTQIEVPNGLRSGVVLAPAPAGVAVELHTQGIQSGGGPCAGSAVATYTTTIK
jgi:hypothetical protein